MKIKLERDVIVKGNISIIAGIDKNSNSEPFERIDLNLGETISIVGPTGSGKTALITDIELLSQGDSITRRKVLIDNATPTDSLRYNPIYKPIVMITQNTKCFSDLKVGDFLDAHSRSRGIYCKEIIDETIELANLFTGEEIKKEYRVTELSGGQTRSLLFADAIKIGASPIILLDEIENAGINKREIIARVTDNNKLIVFVTHDPIIALQTEKRLVMKNGSIIKVEIRNDVELSLLNDVLKIDNKLQILRDRLRAGENLDRDTLSI